LDRLPEGPDHAIMCPECGKAWTRERLAPRPPINPALMVLAMSGPNVAYLGFCWILLFADPFQAMRFLFGLFGLPILFGVLIGLAWPPLFTAAADRIWGAGAARARGMTWFTLAFNSLLLVTLGWWWVLSVVEACASV
jgi:hypothetical protein